MPLQLVLCLRKFLYCKKKTKSFLSQDLIPQIFNFSFGAGGAALFPFITGQVAGKFGILIMPTACIVMAVTMMILWAFIPSDKPMFGACH